jgi:hypothetical protein
LHAAVLDPPIKQENATENVLDLFEVSIMGPDLFYDQFFGHGINNYKSLI